jgi:Tfp pilus assembly PilM family ATPase
LAIGRTSGKGVTVDLAMSVDLGDDEKTSGETVGQRLAAVLTEKGVGNCDALVAVPRGKTELRVLQTPPAPDEELPEMVRFQALQQFSSMREDWPLDFVRLDSGDEEQTRILAAALAPQVVQEIQDSCASCRSPASRLVLRPFATASLFKRRCDDGRCRLLVELLSEEVDLTVLLDGQVVFLRSVRLSAEGLSTALVGEIRRTIAAAQNQLGQRRIEAVTLVGNEDEHAALQEQLDLDVQPFDPFAGTDVGSQLREAMPSHPGRYAALLGMLHDEAEGRPHGIDFLNPRRKPKPPDPRRRYALLGSAAALLLIALIGMIWWSLRSYNNKIESLQTQSKSLEELVSAAERTRSEVGEIDGFVAGDINWLDELYELSKEFPPAEEAIVGEAMLSARPGGGGQMVLKGHVTDHKLIERMESDLRDTQHKVQGGGTQRDERQPGYPWPCTITILVPPTEVEELNDNE